MQKTGKKEIHVFNLKINYSIIKYFFNKNLN